MDDVSPTRAWVVSALFLVAWLLITPGAIHHDLAGTNFFVVPAVFIVLALVKPIRPLTAAWVSLGLFSANFFLGPLAKRFRGLKPPRLPTLFECLVNAIACQQLTLTVGIRLLNRLAETYGTPVRDGGPRAFPRPAQLAGLSAEALRALGFSRAKALSIVGLAAAIETGAFDAEAIESLDNEEAVAALMRLRGIGRWSAEYALLRGLGRLDVFPGDDVGARNNLARRLQRKGPLDYAAVQDAVRPWQPFAGLVYFHLLLANLVERGALTEPAA